MGLFESLNLHLICYTLEGVGKLSCNDGVLIHLDQSKAAFNRVDHQYLVVVLKAAGLGSYFHNWFTAIYGGIKSTV